MAITHPQNIILDGNLLGQLKAEIEDVFSVDNIETPRDAPQGTIIFWGHLLRQDSETVYDLIAERWYAHRYTPLLRQQGQQVALIAQSGVVELQPTNPWINVGLAIATIFSVTFIGASYECGGCLPQTLSEWLGGVPMMLTLMVILLAHEFGHYFAARYHKVSVTLPYFIPLPIPGVSLVGTLGAFIRLRAPFKTKKQLFDIGVAGPLGGLIFALPLIFWGIAHSPVLPLTRGNSSLEGNSIIYLMVKYLVHGRLLPSFDAYGDLPFVQQFLLLLGGVIPQGGGTDVSISSVALAAWFGLLVTAINLMPIGQLDGGHIIYCLIGDKARTLGMVMVVVMLLAGFWWLGWVFWAIIVFLIVGPNHPPPLNDLAPLGLGRTILAYIMIFIFLMLFMPNPFQPI
jgi:membrane-associated protease RseP (regulator of RpoE activity)